MKTSWKEMIQEAMKDRGEGLEDLISNTLSDEEMNQEFENDYRVQGCGKPFTAWTEKTVYFPLSYDGFSSVGSVSRHPDGKATKHQP